MILEGIVTTLNTDGSPNVAPMGPEVEVEAFDTLLLKPFQSSTTFENLKRQPAGVFHVVDDARLLARAAIGCWDEPPKSFPAEKVAGVVLKAACRWFEFEVESLDDAEQRANIRVRVVHTGRLKDFFGWNRAKHAVLEAAILATRVELLAETEIKTQMDPLRIIVEKTAGNVETEAFVLLADYIENHYAKAPGR